ncbi:hypothetical protein [Clostridium thailandense]|uniref:Uncharacterized protein n=1 Tax=Clostridium thailandense TaxID=2794346 RepID=A0A949WSU7_9CLOT|nr:hypothetical protein [Clostridium thailandense]MBV7275481.1 hypothetical protein [Clostridium thailandense]MCH5136657.1 hypothetical protein [Clostridiaceae bacterium UIB06]
MKRLTLSIIIIATLVFLLLSDSHPNPYSSKYYCQTNTSITLNLKKNNKFTLVNALGKSVEYFYGNYSVENNKIALIFDNKYSNLLNTKNINGQVEGTRISFSNFSHFPNQSNLIFNRQ